MPISKAEQAEKNRKYYSANRARILQKMKDEREKNPEKNRLKCKRYHAANIEKLRTSSRRYYAANREKCMALTATYHSENLMYHRGAREQIGVAAEYFVVADLNWKGLEVTKPTNTSSPHDAHVRVGDVWYTVQVKASGVNTKTGTIIRRKRIVGDIASEIIAWVLPDRTIEYESNTDQPLPPELEEGNVKLFTFTCDACDYIQYKRTTLADRINKEHFCPECGEQMSAGEPVEK